MKTVEILKSAKRHESIINQAIEMAYGFLCARYGWRFSDVRLVFTASANRSKYYHRDNRAKIAIDHKLYLYRRKTVGLTTDGLSVGYLLNTACGIVHELTHHVQKLDKRKMSEVETTQNEVAFLTQVDPQWIKFLKPC